MLVARPGHIQEHVYHITVSNRARMTAHSQINTQFQSTHTRRANSVWSTLNAAAHSATRLIWLASDDGWKKNTAHTHYVHIHIVFANRIKVCGATNRSSICAKCSAHESGWLIYLGGVLSMRIRIDLLWMSRVRRCAHIAFWTTLQRYAGNFSSTL